MAKSKLSPTQRTLRALREQGVICTVLEKWNPHVGPHGIRQDAFGFVDVLALYPGTVESFVAVQCCARSGHAAHRRKILENEIAPEWVACGGRIELWSWALQKKKRGGKQMIWVPKVEVITAEMFEEYETKEAA